MAAGPSYSSPCTPPVTSSVGPSCAPRAASTGRAAKPGISVCHPPRQRSPAARWFQGSAEGVIRVSVRAARRVVAARQRLHLLELLAEGDQVRDLLFGV